MSWAPRRVQWQGRVFAHDRLGRCVTSDVKKNVRMPVKVSFLWEVIKVYAKVRRLRFGRTVFGEIYACYQVETHLNGEAVPHVTKQLFFVRITV